MSGRFVPGDLVRARNREWVVLPGSDAETLRLRPLAGHEEDMAVLYLPLEPAPVEPALFPPPEAFQRSGRDGALLLRDALMLSLRRGAGPFRCFGNIAVEPRAYQLVPLMMALRLDPIRLLIADDVGIGKTVEAGLVARELLDRGEATRLSVICPPHLVDQWVAELGRHFHLNAAPVTSGGAARLERGLPVGASLFVVHPITVVSLDYVKSDRRRDDFVRACPELVIVDEAHVCTMPGERRHQRYELLRRLADDPRRHLILVTATPHSGDEAAFHRLLGLLDRRFERLALAGEVERTDLRDGLSLNFVQRRRRDIETWQDARLFPKREIAELTYRLGGRWRRLFDDVLDYCADVTEAAGSDERRRRLTFWGTLAVMRCVASSPAAAARALRTRAGLASESAEELLEASVFDVVEDGLTPADAEPATPVEDARLANLVEEAEALARETGDPKLRLLGDHLRDLLGEGFSPIVFCRYIATAHYLAHRLRSRLPGVTIEAITGDLPPEAREEAVATLSQAERRVLVATDCLSEGINLQDGFDAVVHYDLSWNPTRHEQREGRVDRFGQKRPVVRATLIWGEDNEIDAAVLKVILRKAEKIREDLGVPVPLPDEGQRLTEALMRAVMLRRRAERRQLRFDFDAEREAERQLDIVWRDAAERAKRSRTVFAQNRLRPDEVLPEWRKALAALGGEEDVHRFVSQSLARLGAPLDPRARGGWRLTPRALPEDLRERLVAEAIEEPMAIDFALPAPSGVAYVHRSHPLVTALADGLLERTLAAESPEMASDPALLGRCGCWIVEGVKERTIVGLFRLRHRLILRRESGSHEMLVEEAAPFGWSAGEVLDAESALACLELSAAGDLPEPVRARETAAALARFAAATDEIEHFVRSRGEALLGDHRRVRDAAGARGRYDIESLLPADLVGAWVLLPRL
jgi:superfamily II DNA or RNA helicase